MTTSKPVDGFDLILGELYNDGWFNRCPPRDDDPCAKCHGTTTIHSLHKFIFAFGQVIEKFTSVVTCPHCLHECELDSYKKEKRKKATKKNLVTIFSKLSRDMQAALLISGGIK